MALLATPARGQSSPRDGVELRAALGASYVNDTRAPEHQPETEYEGFGPSVSVWAGQSLMPGLALGGMASAVGSIDGSAPGTADASALLGQLGPYVDWFPIADQGFHMFVTLGFALYPVEREALGLGGGVLYGAGYDWPLDCLWGLGLQGSLQFVVLQKDDVAHYVLVPSLTATLARY